MAPSCECRSWSTHAQNNGVENQKGTILLSLDFLQVAPGILEVNAAVNDAKGEDAGVPIELFPLLVEC